MGLSSYGPVSHVALVKLRSFLRRCDAPHLNESDFDTLGASLRDLRDRAASDADRDRLAFIRALCSEQTRALTMFRRGEQPSGGSMRFEALGNQPVNQIADAAGLETSGMPELAAGLGLISRTATSTGSTVDVSPTADGRRGVLRVTGGVGETAVFFAANPQAGVRLQTAGIVPADANNVLVIHSSGPVPYMQRTPRARLGRTGRKRPRNVDMSTLLRESTGLRELERLPKGSGPVSASPPVERVVAVLQEAGYDRLPQPVEVAGIPFEFAATLVARAGLDLVLVVDTITDNDEASLRLRVDGLGRALDLVESRRPLTVILVGPEPAADLHLSLTRVARVLTAGTRGDEHDLRRGIAVLLPLEPQAVAEMPESWRSAREKLLRAHPAGAHALEAANGGPAAVADAVRTHLLATDLHEGEAS